MQKLTENLVSLALQPRWDDTVSKMAAEIQQALTENEQALLKEKIICFVISPAPEEPKQPEQPEPEEPEKQDPKEDLPPKSVKLAG
ncbi:hypothetical protein GCM10010919_31160 [Alishewanella longhuensis]|uniref:Uncharacterized protein n=1 Tax=Alishewanella longhuensis TaxID=1091037 RepID=A0ABQ3L6Z6_9ALTE|nr:hypothetical protein [Alishewanella longhuensis]GHG76360.1 hypothetical protein GCM10010919_31160 [Alishewanella longhuensis]